MTLEDAFKEIREIDTSEKSHPKCKSFMDEYTMEWDCGYYTFITCDECKYGLGRKDPEAKCNSM